MRTLPQLYILFASIFSVPGYQQLMDSAWTLYEKGDLHRARKVNDACIRESRLARETSTEAQCMINNGTVYYVDGDFRRAYACYDSSYNLYKTLGDTVKTVDALRNMALTSRRLSRYEQGIRHCNSALMLVRNPAYDHLRARVLNTLSTILESTNNLQQAKIVLLQALPITQEDHMPYLLNNLGNIYFKITAFDSAIYYYKRGIALSVEPMLTGLILNNLGESYIRIDSLPKAFQALSESHLLRKTNDSLALISTYNNFAQLFLRQNHADEAEQYLVKVDNMLRTTPNEREALKYFSLKKTYFENKGLYKQALEFDKLYDSLNHKLFEDERIKASELRTEFELNERDQQLAIQQQSLRQKTIITNFSIGVAAVLALLCALMFSLYRLNVRLRHKNELLVREQSHRVKNNLQMIASLLGIQSSSHSDSAVRSILSENETRIQSVALLHRMLYNKEVSANVSLQKYFEELSTELKHALGARDALITVDSQIVNLPVEITTSLGLILNELITNSVKYAKYEDKLEMRVTTGHHDSEAWMRYSDNGSQFDTTSFSQSDRFGVQLISLQVKQLSGDFTIINDGGFNFILKFPIS